jgi:shikimate dehydrogenase
MQHGNPSATRLFLLLGDPVAHSLSPVFQNAAIRARGIDAIYATLRCDRASVAPLIRALCRAGGGGNVTVPHKAAAAECLENATPAVRRTGVCNVFWGDADGAIHGDNTDIEGFRAAALELLPSLRGIAALVLGAGGAAAAAAAALLDDGARSVLILNRSPDRAFKLAARLDPDAAVMRAVSSMGETRGQQFDLVVNALTASGDDATRAFDLAVPARVHAALDLAYGQRRSTAWVQHARSLGIPAADGTSMLIAQGAAAFTRWFGGDPPLAAMRAAMGA